MSLQAAEELRAEIKKEAEGSTTFAEYANWIRKQDTEAVAEYWKSLLADSEITHIYGREKKDSIKNENIITFTTAVSEEAVRKAEKLAKEKAAFEREKRQQKAVAEIKKRYGKNAILKGMNFEEGATTIDRNRQIGGHRA